MSSGNARTPRLIAGNVLNGCVMTTVAAAATGVVDASTTLRFRQDGRLFSARYDGGAIFDGLLVGTISPDGSVSFRYAQADREGRLDQGVSTGQLMRLEDGRLRLTESFQWLTRPGGGENVFEEPEPASGGPVAEPGRPKPRLQTVVEDLLDRQVEQAGDLEGEGQ